MAISLTGFWLTGDRPAPGYGTAASNGTPLAWGPSSPAGIWNDSTKTLSWSFDSVGFPHVGWPTAAQAGAAVQNAFQSLQDVPGTALHHVRLPDTQNPPVSGDGIMQVCFAAAQSPDFFGQDISGEVAVTYLSFDATSGTLLDADVELNGASTGASPTWTTDAPSPAGALDVESVALHHAMTALGASSSPYFSAAAWPLERSPGDAFRDRCLSPDDRMFLRTIAPGSPAFSTVTGTVTIQGAGTPCVLAIVVATDGDGIPQAETVTRSDGTYTLNIPSATNDLAPLTDYTVTAHHFLNGTYSPASSTDLQFTGSVSATGFIAVPSPAAIDTRNTLTGVDFTVIAGTPTLTLVQQSLSPDPLGTQVLFLDPGGPSASGTLQFLFQNQPGSFTGISSLDLGPGITLGAPTLTAMGPSQTELTVSYSISTPTVAGPRSLSFSVPSGEQFFLPAVVEIVGQGALAVAAGPENPSSSNPVNSQAEVPLLQVVLTGSPDEDVRIHQLSFSLSGQGALPTAVRLWNDRGTTPGAFDALDQAVLTGAAYAHNPVAETLVPPGLPSTIAFDDLALTIPAGTSLTLLLTADMPSAGTGSYAASFDPTDPAAVTVQGMTWGDAIAPGGSLVSGGLVTLGIPSIGLLGQTRSDTSSIPVGGLTTETQVTILGQVSSPSGQVGMEVEVKPVGTAFDGTGTVVQAAASPSPSSLTLVVPGLASGTLYHWRARGISSTGLSSPWVSFGSNPESSTDFSVDQSTVGAPTALTQIASLTGAVVPPGGSAESGILLSAQTGADSLGYPVQIQFEVRPSSVAFVNLPTSTLNASGTVSLGVSGTSGTFHWQARTVSLYGQVSSWTPMSGTPNDFTLTAPPVKSASGGCIASVGGDLLPAGGRGILGIAAGLALLLLLPRRSRRIGGTAAALLAATALAQADPDPELPRSVLEAPPVAESLPESPLPLPGDSELPRSLWQDSSKEEPPKTPPGPISLNVYGGALFLDTSWKALGTDHVEHELSGNGQALVGMDLLYTVADNWQIGVGAQGSFWGDIYTIGAGPVVTWRFAHASATGVSGRFRWEHFLRAQIAYESFKVTKSGIGSFDPTVGVVLGYEWRLNLIRHYGLTLGADLQYAEWKYSSPILSGDTKVGGLGGFVYLGITLFP